MARILLVDPQAAAADVVLPAVEHLPGVNEVAVVDALVVARDAGQYDVLVAGPGLDTRAGLKALGQMQEADPAVSIVLAFDRRPRVSLTSVVRAGAVDLLTTETSTATAVAALERAVRIAEGRRAAGGGTRPTSKGTVITVASASGGCGKTFFAVNAAYHLMRATGGRACIVDLDLQFGEVSTALRLAPELTLFDAHERDTAGEARLEDHLDDYLVRHDTGVHVLPAPRDPSEADRVDPQDVLRIIEAARSRFDYVVVDTPAALSEVVLAALDVSELLYVMTTLDVPSVRNLGVFLSTLARLKVPSESIRLVMNKAESGVGMQVDEVARLFPGGFNAVLPYASVVSRSLNQGTPVLASFPTAEVSRKLAAALDAMVPADKRGAARVVEGPARVRLLDRLLRVGGSR
ncbi:MAG TPA: AAA family ATPase [Acidimicrobiales bacterium]|jgi:pilus assembly protein CpaE|nr:AAA family ATPase [Acidimicrobiales bacterium]